jgi:hypothetical protein
LQFDIGDGELAHVALNGDDAPLAIERWQGHARLRDGKLEIEKAGLSSASGQYRMTGTASLGRELDLKIFPGAEAKGRASSAVYSITGTVAEPHVMVIPTPETQAKLKP